MSWEAIFFHVRETLEQRFSISGAIFIFVAQSFKIVNQKEQRTSKKNNLEYLLTYFNFILFSQC